MLKKLFVHEWKDCWRLVGLMNLIVIGLTLIGRQGRYCLDGYGAAAADR